MSYKKSKRLSEPFYRRCIITKLQGGRKALFSAKLSPTYNGGPECILMGVLDGRQRWISLGDLCGAGNTADNAIKDLSKQIRDVIARKAV